MAYVPVPKDFSKIKTKLALNLTKRQIICFSLAGICGVPVYLLTKAGLGTDVAATLMIIVMLIVQHMVWTRVSQNRSRRKSTRYYVDEFHRTRRSAC